MYIVQATTLIEVLVELNIPNTPSAAIPKNAIPTSLILSPPSSGGGMSAHATPAAAGGKAKGLGRR
jgi:hypothetical protein